MHKGKGRQKKSAALGFMKKGTPEHKGEAWAG